MTADLTPQGTPWRTTAPDAPGWWFVDRDMFTNPRIQELAYQQDVDACARDWREGWRCAPVLSVAEAREQGRREGLQEAAGIADAVCAAGRRRDGRDDARAGGWRDSAEHVADRIRALIPAAPRPEPFCAGVLAPSAHCGRPPNERGRYCDECEAAVTQPEPPREAPEVWYRMDADGNVYPPPGLDPAVDAELAKREAPAVPCPGSACEHNECEIARRSGRVTVRLTGSRPMTPPFLPGEVETPPRRGANWTPPTSGARCYEGSDGGPCIHCARLIRHHFGGTEYRCDPRPVDAMFGAERGPVVEAPAPSGLVPCETCRSLIPGPAVDDAAMRREARAFRAAEAIKALGRHPIVAHVTACPECHQHARMYCDEGRAIIAAHSAACDAAEEEQREALAALDAARGKR